MKKNHYLILFFFILTTVSFEGQDFPERQRINDLLNNMERMFNEIDYITTTEDEYYIGRAVAVNIFENYRLSTDNFELTQYLNSICQAIVINSSLPPMFNGYKVALLESNEFNAFATPGGHIFITIGLVKTAPCEDALAGIIAHELAHILLKHGMKMIEEMGFVNILDSNAQRAAGNSSQNILEFRNLINELVNTMVISGYSVPQEFEADTTALSLLASAGYSPGGLLDMLYILQRIQSNQRGGFNSTHPVPTDRIANVQRQMSLYHVTDTDSYRVNRFRYIMGDRAD